MAYHRLVVACLCITATNRRLQIREPLRYQTLRNCRRYWLWASLLPTCWLEPSPSQSLLCFSRLWSCWSRQVWRECSMNRDRGSKDHRNCPKKPVCSLREWEQGCRQCTTTRTKYSWDELPKTREAAMVRPRTAQLKVPAGIVLARARS